MKGSLRLMDMQSRHNPVCRDLAGSKLLEFKHLRSMRYSFVETFDRSEFVMRIIGVRVHVGVCHAWPLVPSEGLWLSLYSLFYSNVEPLLRLNSIYRTSIAPFHTIRCSILLSDGFLGSGVKVSVPISSDTPHTIILLCGVLWTACE